MTMLSMASWADSSKQAETDMARCAACEQLARTMPNGVAHQDLVQTGTARRKYFAHAVGNLVFYRCYACEQQWEHESGKSDLHVGWSLVTK